MASSSTTAEDAPVLDAPAMPRLSSIRRYTLLLIFCLAQFVDAFNLSSLFSAIPVIKADLGVSDTESVWLISAFALTFASFLLLSGRISDVYDPKHAFAVGISGLGALSLGAGFLQSRIPLLVLRALMGCMAALTIPSALALLVIVFPERHEQARAIGVFGASGCMGNVIGLLIGAVFVQYASWRWVFWFVACAALPVAAVCTILIPPNLRRTGRHLSARQKLRSLDLIGVTILTIALVLFIFAVTSGTTAGWSSAQVIAPLVISVFLIAVFFYYETLIPASVAAIPPRTWFYPNFAVLFFVSMLPYFWWSNVHNLFISLWQTQYHWSAISTAIHTFPLGLVAFAMTFTGGLTKNLEPKWLILGAQLVVVVATILFNWTDAPERYWRFVFPAFFIGSGGAMLAFTNSNIAIFRTSPPSMAGTVGAIYNGGLQLGMAVGYAVCGSVQGSIDAREAHEGGTDGYAGRRAAFRVLLGFVCIQAIAVAVFMRPGQVGYGENDETAAQSDSDSAGNTELKAVSDTEKGESKEDIGVQEIQK